jgi:hypothetical protein
MVGAPSEPSREQDVRGEEPKVNDQGQKDGKQIYNRDKGKAEEGPCDPSRDRAVIGGIE